MFIQVIVLAIIIGFIQKGNLKNLSNLKFRGVIFLIAGFVIEAIIILLVRQGIIVQGPITFISDLLLYSLLFVFVIKNKSDSLIYLVGLGFLLNAVAIFANGGTMPVTLNAVNAIGLSGSVATEGLYKLVDTNTRLWFLGDIIPYTFINKNIISIGDIILSLGIMLIIIREMKKKFKTCNGKCTRVCKRTCIKD